jgi:hypothetical protein
MMINRVKFPSLFVYIYIYVYIYTEEDIGWQIKYLGLSMNLLGKLRYRRGTAF